MPRSLGIRVSPRLAFCPRSRCTTNLQFRLSGPGHLDSSTAGFSPPYIGIIQFPFLLGVLPFFLPFLYSCFLTPPPVFLYFSLLFIFYVPYQSSTQVGLSSMSSSAAPLCSRP
ncbi:hypothetical protein BT67DRAFT_200839 [Trichocladium antarcticum]|uniref:Uncharacterized protein n=1 Tax=Trichocladium antarcticum TaxID=1450529 RepID=A0AAN6UQK9_9PEZI|nr:hypothetical protein BT67DRAFT_200839 [Trichocladium antarcticum]